MIVTTLPQQLTLLPLPEVVQSALTALVVEPFGDMEATAAFWSEQHCSLLCLLDDDTETQALADTTISRLLDYPESTDLLPEDWRLTLSITADSGSGQYLLYQRSMWPELEARLAASA